MHTVQKLILYTGPGGKTLILLHVQLDNMYMYTMTT